MKVNLSRMLVFAAAATVLASASLVGTAHADSRYPSYPSDPYQDPRYNHDSDVLNRYLGQRFDGFNVLDIRQLFNLDYQYRGRRVESVSITARADGGMAHAQLIVNGAQTGFEQTLGGFTQEYTFYLSGYNDIIDRSLNRLELTLQGRWITVENISIRFVNDGYAPTPEPTPYPTYPPYPTPYPTYPPYPPMPPRPAPYPGHGPGSRQVFCQLTTTWGAFTGVGRSQGEAVSSARSQCYARLGAYRCDSGRIACGRH